MHLCASLVLDCVSSQSRLEREAFPHLPNPKYLKVNISPFLPFLDVSVTFLSFSVLTSELVAQRLDLSVQASQKSSSLGGKMLFQYKTVSILIENVPFSDFDFHPLFSFTNLMSLPLEVNGVMNGDNLAALFFSFNFSLGVKNHVF